MTHAAAVLSQRSWAAAVLWLLVATGPAARAQNQTFDCEDVDHDCAATRDVGRGVSRGGVALLRCFEDGTGADACDLTAALSGIADEQCRSAVECQLRQLAALVGDGSTRCVQELFRQGYKFMATKVRRVQRNRLSRVPDDLARCKDLGGRRCVDPIAPSLTDACVGKTTPVDGAGCVCAAADGLSNRMLLTPPTCTPPAAPAAARGLASAAASGRPNFVFILSDDQRFDTVDATHQSPKRPGPVMPIVTSELVNSGVTFTNGHVTTSLCCPSRTSILTGDYSHRTGVHDNDPPDGGAEVFDDSQTIAIWLHDAGYRTGFIGKYLNGYSSLSPCIPPGYDEWHVQVQVKFYEYDLNDNGTVTHFDSAATDYSGEVMTQRAVQFIHDSAGGRPFFLHVSQKAPHAPAIAYPTDIGLFDGIAPWRPANYAVAPTNGPAWVQSLTWSQKQADSTDAFRIKQLESLQDVDRGVGAIMQALRDIGEDGSTLVIYTSDNGFSLGSHKWKPKTCPYEECIRVPLIMRYPPLVTAPRTDNRFVLNIDFAPTFLELANTQAPSGFVVNGQSVVPLLAGGPVTWRDDLLNEHWNGKIPTNALVKQGRCSTATTTVCKTAADCGSGQTCNIWKYVEYVTSERELYNLTTDPSELNNVAGDPANATLKASLATRLHQLQAQ